MIVEACCSAVVVLPHHLGPSIKTAPIPDSFRCNSLSAILGLYVFIPICWLQGKDNTILQNYRLWLNKITCFGQNIYRHSAMNFSAFWILFRTTGFVARRRYFRVKRRKIHENAAISLPGIRNTPRDRLFLPEHFINLCVAGHKPAMTYWLMKVFQLLSLNRNLVNFIVPRISSTDTHHRVSLCIVRYIPTVWGIVYRHKGLPEPRFGRLMTPHFLFDYQPRRSHRAIETCNIHERRHHKDNWWLPDWNRERQNPYWGCVQNVAGSRDNRKYGGIEENAGKRGDTQFVSDRENAEAMVY